MPQVLKQICYTLYRIRPTPSAVRIQYVYAVQKQQRERINVTRKHIKLMRERESVRTHAHFFCSVTKPDALAQIHAALARRKCAHLKRVFSRSNCVLCTHNSLYAHVLDINYFRTFLFLAFYRVQCERSDPLTWARKKGASQTVCEPGVT